MSVKSLGIHKARLASGAAKPLRRLMSGNSDRWLPLRLSVHIIAMLLIAFVFALTMWLLIGAPDLAGPYKDAKTSLEAAKLVLGVTAGLGGVVALVVAYRRQRDNEVAEDRENTRAFSERFTSAAEQLSSDQSANRLAGVYAMAHLADDWNTGRQTCINVLCAYMRMPYELPGDLLENANDDDIKKHRGLVEEGQVRRAIMDTVGERLRAGPVDGKTWHGHDFDFSTATIHAANLHGARFTGGTVDFGHARFSRGRVDFADAEFTGGLVHFVGAEFSGGTVSFQDANFSGGSVQFLFAKVTGGKVGFVGAEFSGGSVDFAEAKFSGGSVDFSLAKFSGGSVQFLFAKVTGGSVDFVGAEFSGGSVDFGGAEFSGGSVSFTTAKFSGGIVDFKSAWFSGGTVGFLGVEFSDGTVDFAHAAFVRAGSVDLLNAKFSGGIVDFRTATFARSVLDVDGEYGSPVPQFGDFPDGPPDGLQLPSE